MIACQTSELLDRQGKQLTDAAFGLNDPPRAHGPSYQGPTIRSHPSPQVATSRESRSAPSSPAKRIRQRGFCCHISADNSIPDVVGSLMRRAGIFDR